MARQSAVVSEPSIAEPALLQQQLLAWSQTHLRDLPWRQTRDPWSILVSEIMLQQTQVNRVIERHAEFMHMFPNPTACADGSAAAVIRLWDGLGFNRRAVNLWKAACAIRDDHGGAVPDQLSGLLALPGIGPYTARAVLAFAFEHDVGVVDTNVGRLLARWSGQTLTPRQAQNLANAMVPPGCGWVWNQTLFDFANEQCRRREPECSTCTLQTSCSWRGAGNDPALASAGVSAPQTPFAGSRRQVRGRLVKALRTSAIQVDELAAFATRAHPPEVVQALVADLVSDGLAEWHDTELRLSGASSTDGEQ